jgi:uncharacterized protein (TIGR02246 family)
MSSPVTDPATADDVSAINAIAHRWRRAFTEGDAGLFVDDYADDAMYVNAFGRACRGGPAIAAFLQEVFDRGDFAAATVTASPPEIRFVRPDVAVAHDFGVTRGQRTTGGAEHPERRTHHQRVLAKDSGRWRVVAHLISDENARQA